MKLCLSVGVAGLVFFLQDRQSYKEFLTYRGTDAQTLLDLLQDVSTSLPMQFYFTQGQSVSGSRFLFGRQTIDIQSLV
jgi:hypothetical protein